MTARHPASWRTQAALAIGKGRADAPEFAAADRVLDALAREGALLTDRQRALLRPSARETPGDRPSAPVAARTDATGTPQRPRPFYECELGVAGDWCARPIGHAGQCDPTRPIRPTSPTGDTTDAR